MTALINVSKSTSFSLNSISMIMLYIVGFFYSNPKLYIAALSSFLNIETLGSIFPVFSVSKSTNASLIS